MVAALRLPRKFTEDEYLHLERQAEFKSEYIDGYIYPMAGGTQLHSLISASAIMALGTALKGTNCRVHTSDMRICVPHQRFYSYPDVSVVCGEPKFKDVRVDTITNPILIIEVLSPSTEMYELTDKFERYKQLASLHYYMLISQNEPWVEVNTRKDEGIWDARVFKDLSDVIDLNLIGCKLDVAELYDQVDFSKRSDS